MLCTSSTFNAVRDPESEGGFVWKLVVIWDICRLLSLFSLEARCRWHKGAEGDLFSNRRKLKVCPRATSIPRASKSVTLGSPPTPLSNKE
jgi:hypothetical protein